MTMRQCPGGCEHPQCRLVVVYLIAAQLKTLAPSVRRETAKAALKLASGAARTSPRGRR
jgi:hypothetical protein